MGYFVGRSILLLWSRTCNIYTVCWGDAERFLAVDVGWISDVESAQALNSFLSTGNGQFDFGGIYFALGFAVQLWDPED